MKHTPKTYLNPLVARDIIDVTDRLYGSFAVVVGVVLILNHPNDVQSIPFQVAEKIPGGMFAWAVTIVLFGATMLAGALWRNRRFLFWGAFWCASWSMLFAVALLVAAVRNEGAGQISAVVWGMFTLLYTVHAVARTKRFEAVPAPHVDTER